MEHEEVIDNKDKDFAHNWVSSSRFFFIARFFYSWHFILGGCYTCIYTGIQGKPEVKFRAIPI